MSSLQRGATDGAGRPLHDSNYQSNAPGCAFASGLLLVEPTYIMYVSTDQVYVDRRTSSEVAHGGAGNC